MSKDQPQKITLNFIQDIQTRGKRSVNFLGENIIIHKGVFPVDSPFSYSSKMTANAIPQNSGVVLDVGTGTGVQGIIAVKKGARKVISIDIDDPSLLNAQENVKFHNLQGLIEVRKSNLFQNIKKTEKFDLIISQLPFADVKYKSPVSHFLFDPDFNLHKRLLQNAKNYLKKGGKILIPSGDVADENKLNNLINQYGYKIVEIKKEKFENLIWKVYTVSF